MPVSVQDLYSKVNCGLSTAANGTLACCQLTGAQQFLQTSVQRVESEANLPTACSNEGRLIFVNDQCRYFYSNGWEWTTCFSSIPTAQADLLFTWGFNKCGELGNNTFGIAVCSPVTTSGLGTTWSKVASGGFVVGAIKDDGTLWTWGWNNNGQLGDNTVLPRSSPGTVSGGGTTWCNLAFGGHVTASGGANNSMHGIGLKRDGTLWTWGSSTCGQLGNNSTTSRCSPGSTTGGGTTWCQASAGAYISMAVKTDGTLWTWGMNNCGQLGDGTVVNRSSPVTTIGGGTTWCQASVDFRHGSAVKTDGTLWTWGCNNCGALGDGTVTCRSSPDTVAGGGTTWCQVSAGFATTAGVKTDGTLWTWGFNNAGQLGIGNTTPRCSPGTTAGGGTTWCFISVGSNCDFNSTAIYVHMAGIKTDATLWTWGVNQNIGVLGNGTTAYRNSPGTTAGNCIGWCTVSAGNWTTGAIASCIRGFL